MTGGQCTLFNPTLPRRCDRSTLLFLNQLLLVEKLTIDSTTVKALLTTFAPDVDYMADHDEWLLLQVREDIILNVQTLTGRLVRN